jgi:hypothetical protein
MRWGALLVFAVALVGCGGGGSTPYQFHALFNAPASRLQGARVVDQGRTIGRVDSVSRGPDGRSNATIAFTVQRVTCADGTPECLRGEIHDDAAMELCGTTIYVTANPQDTPLAPPGSTILHNRILPTGRRQCP